jgi:NADPH:quinone reductase-like Zn-dependent oxidoreductase
VLVHLLVEALVKNMANKKVVIHEFGGPDVIQVVIDSPLPEPQSGEVRVRVEASSAGTTDTVIRKGIYPLLKNKPPFTLGYDLIGVVDKVANDVHHLQVGQRVCGLSQIGSNSEYLCLPAVDVILVPNSVDAAQAVCLVLSYMTAYQMLHHFAKVKPGNRVLIHGAAGAVGTALLQLGKDLRLEMVGTASESKLPHIRAYGVKAIDNRSRDYERQLIQSAGTGFDAAFDATNHKSFNRSFRLLKPGGKLVIFGTFNIARTIRKKTTLNFLMFGLSFGWMMLKLSVWNLLPNQKRAMFFGIIDSKKNYPDRFTQDLHQLFKMLSNGQIEPVIAQEFSLDDALQAHMRLDEGNFCGQLVFILDTLKKAAI